MSERIINQLTFRTNAKFILNLLQSAAAGRDCPPLFSLHSIKPMPDALTMPDVACLKPLLALNMEIPPLEDGIRRQAQAHLLSQPPVKADAATLQKKIAEIGQALKNDQAAAVIRQAGQSRLAWFEQAVANYARFKFFNQYDWRMAHWGTVADILSVVESTFELPTSLIEFTTLWTPPLAALQELADMFPSVRFELRYRSESDTAWTPCEIFPVKPWGY